MSRAQHRINQILDALHAPRLRETKLSQHPSSSAAKLVQYVSPYSVDCPVDYIIIHNRSKNAANFAVRKLKEAWPKLKVIHVVQENRNPIPNSDIVVRISGKKWSNMAHFRNQFNAVAAINPDLLKSMEAGKVGFYCVWSSAAESSEWAIAAQEAGFKWMGASPDKMRGLDKIDYKNLCKKLGLPTADFIEIKAPAEIKNKEEALKIMAQTLVDLYNKTPELAGKPVFAKHNMGGGGKGTKKIAEMNYKNALAAIQKIVNETGGNLNGVYVEMALDLQGAQLFQIEIECDAGQVAPGGRLVWFNKENQKVIEIGFTDAAILQILPKEIYDACRLASEKVFKASGYDSRGTNEILILNDNGQWSFFSLELNKRIQVENEALSELVVDHQGHTRNVPAEQVMRACGYPPPSEKDYREKGCAIVAHVRLLSCEVTPAGSIYPSGLEIDGAFYPQCADVQFARGPVYLDADPQIGRALITAKNWQELCDKLLNFCQEFQFHGPKTQFSTYFDFMRKLAADSAFRQGKLGCNETIKVLHNPPVAKGEVQKTHEALMWTVTPLITHGYRPGEGVKDQPYPSAGQIAEFADLIASLRLAIKPETPFSAWLKHHDYDRYINDLKHQLNQHGGGTVTVIRDVLQSSYDQESALTQKISAQLAEIFFAGSGIGIGFETGGAQYQAGLMRKFCWMAVLLAGCLTNLPSHSLTRSKWLNGLNIKTTAEQAFVFQTIAFQISRLYGLPSKMPSFLPWAPYNFHAGNHPEQDITTREMLRANLAVIPCWAWDPRYTEEQFQGWVIRQIRLFAEEKKPLSQIRIKNPGQGPEWKTTAIVKMVQTIRKTFKNQKFEEPVIFVHNHEFNGEAAHIGAKALKECQALGYRFLVVDSAPPGNSHNSNLVIADALEMTDEEKSNLQKYNQGVDLLLRLTRRFDNQPITRIHQNPRSKMAGGTNSSDFVDAKKMGIPTSEVGLLIELARKLIGLGTPVTPYSEYLKQIGFAIWSNVEIKEKTVEGATKYINNGGKLAIAPAILQALREWLTLLPRPAIVEKLLINHGLSLDPIEEKVRPEIPLDIEGARRMLQAELPNTEITDVEISTWFAFDKIGLAFLKHRDHSSLADGPRDMTFMMGSPEFAHSQFKKVGDSFKLFGKEVTITHLMSNKQTGLIDIIFSYNGHSIRASGLDPDKIVDAAIKQVKLVTDKRSEVGAPMAGALVRFFVKPGAIVKKDEQIATLMSMKMEHSVNSPRDGIISSVRGGAEGDMVESNEVLATLAESAPEPLPLRPRL